MEKKYAIMFADIAGSTKLYDTLGDEVAEQKIASCLKTMSDITEMNNGTVIKTIGDEIMSCFNTADEATDTAMELQNAMESSDLGLSIRVGMQYGEAIERDGDIYGDAVNVAARMAGVAKARQIITTEHLVSELNARLAEYARLYDTARVKGKEQELNIYQINWEEESKVTRFATSHEMKKISASTVAIVLKYGDVEKLYTDADLDGAVSIGKDSCDITIKASYASRSHLDLKFSRGKFVLSDHSTNGTYVRFQGQKEDVFIRREELPLLGEGVISLGELTNENSPYLIHFSVLQRK